MIPVLSFAAFLLCPDGSGGVLDNLQLNITLSHATDLSVTACLVSMQRCVVHNSDSHSHGSAGSPGLEPAAAGVAAVPRSVSSSEEDAAGRGEAAAHGRPPQQQNALGRRGAGAPDTMPPLLHLSHTPVPLSWRPGQVPHAMLSNCSSSAHACCLRAGMLQCSCALEWREFPLIP